MADLRLQTFASYLRVAGVGFGPSQYQCMVLRLTSFAQVLSSSLVFKKNFSRKPNSSMSICGRRLTEKNDGQMLGKKEGLILLNGPKTKQTRTGAYRTGVKCPKLYRQAYVRYPLDDTSSRQLLRRNIDFSNPCLSPEFHI